MQDSVPSTFTISFPGASHPQGWRAGISPLQQGKDFSSPVLEAKVKVFSSSMLLSEGAGFSENL